MKRLYEETHGRAVLLQDKMDARLQAYIRKVHEGGRTISALVVIAAACGILLSCEKCALKNKFVILPSTFSGTYFMVQSRHHVALFMSYSHA